MIRIRANAHNHNIVHVEEKDLKALTKDGLDVDFRPGEMLGNLHTLFSGLKSKLPKLEGKYLLSHDARSGPFVRVLVADEVRQFVTYVLHKDELYFTRGNPDLCSGLKLCSPKSPIWKAPTPKQIFA